MKTTSLFRLALWITGLFFYAGSALGQGRIIFPPFPEPHFHPQPVSLSSVDARVDIRDGVAEVQLGQEFYNPNNRELEGDYLFAIPGEAQIRDFSLYINGRKQQGQILDAREAQKIYEDIVRRLVDPALLQYAGQGLFKTRIFPFPARGNREVEIRYATVLGYENNLYRLVLPVRQSGQASIDRYNLTINLSSRDALGNIYSPTHALSVQRNGDREATITLSQNGFAGDKDIVLYYSLRDQGDIPANLLTFRPRTDEDGFFMWMATPAEVRQAARIPRDLTFVVDVSGSMQGEKMVQAREALKFAVGTLKREDRFQILAFSSTVRAFQRGLLPATRENLENARYFIDELRPGGGTNIEEALLNALDAKKARDNRMTAIVFLTDGLPTVGETDIARLLEKIKREGNEFTRLFNFGVGYDVNTFLLDKLAEESRGSSNYVRPEENIEEAVSNFVSKIGDPILTDPDLAFGNLPVYDVFPARLPDLFAGQRVLVMGRYRSPADGNFELTGRQGGRRQTLRYPVSLPRRNRENDFIAPLWANRKVAFLLEQIRFHGENRELIEEVKQLGEAYGIITPYTSYLVTEEGDEMAREPGNEDRSRSGAGRAAAREKRALMDNFSLAPQASTGASAVESSKMLQKMAEAEQEANDLVTVRRIGGRTFKLEQGIWAEQNLPESLRVEKIPFASEAYFDLARQHPELAQILGLGKQVKFRLENRVIVIDE